MKICFPVETEQGLDSKVFGHFGSAPTFILVDLESEKVSAIKNDNSGHVHGNCSPVNALDGNSVEALVVGGMGTGAINKLNAMGIKVFKAESELVKENLSLYREQKLPELTIEHGCGGHSGGCSH